MSLIPAEEASFAKSLLAKTPTPSPQIKSVLKTLNLQSHIEGGYFVETDRDALLIPNPFLDLPLLTNATSKDTSETRNASTTIHYLLSPSSPVGHFHRNRARTVHTLHWGRGRYVIIHFDQFSSSSSTNAKVKPRIETFIVGHDITAGEQVQWIVEGGKFKASFLLPDDPNDGVGKGGGTQKGLLISETVVPGFEFSDHDFMTAEMFMDAVGEEGREELKWLLKKSEQAKVRS
jgi:uncharacterized protein